MPDPTPTTGPGTTDDDLGYADAVSELDQILRELESSDVDVDRLASRVTRASELIALCRERITYAQVEIRRVTADLNAAATPED